VSGRRVDYFPEARLELESAFDWYLERSPRAADAFLREVERAVALIAAAPRIWPRFDADTQRYVLQGFPYSVVYRAAGGRIVIVAVAHHKRRPQYWYRRLSR
jgi:plasmid stabilization system protein ParE